MALPVLNSTSTSSFLSVKTDARTGNFWIFNTSARVQEKMDNCSGVQQIWKSRYLYPCQPTSRQNFLKLSRVKRRDFEETISHDGVMLDEQALERDLQIAIEEEDYTRAAEIRDNLRILHEDSKSSVLKANSHFYNAFRNGDLAAMNNIWSKGDNVCCVHPGAGGISGYELVMGSWEYVLGAEHEFPLEIELKNVEVYVKGDIGYVTCLEIVKTKGSSWGKQVATNVFERIDGQWLLCIHHASHVDL